MKVRALITHKLCEHYADCQDRFSINKDSRTVAVSDGMSQSIFPDYWADLLSVQYVKEGHCNEADRIKLCGRWLQKVEEYRDEQVKLGKNPWKLNNFLAAHKGAGATICGVRFDNATDWRGDVLGDSCIIEVDMETFTINVLSSQEKAFDYYPDYYDSFSDKKGRGVIKSFSGTIGPNKHLLLVSDPFSEFIDKHKDDCETHIQQILQLNSHLDFCKLVDDWRNRGMHNDDSTLCIIEFDGDLNFNVHYQDDISSLIQKEEQEETIIAEVEITPKDTGQEQGNNNEEENNELYKTIPLDILKDFFFYVIKEFDSLLSKKNKLRHSLKKENINKHDISEIKQRIIKEYKRLTTSD